MAAAVKMGRFHIREEMQKGAPGCSRSLRHNAVRALICPFCYNPVDGSQC
jgi:hypothetical protein